MTINEAAMASIQDMCSRLDGFDVADLGMGREDNLGVDRISWEISGAGRVRHLSLKFEREYAATSLILDRLLPAEWMNSVQHGQ